VRRIGKGIEGEKKGREWEKEADKYTANVTFADEAQIICTALVSFVYIVKYRGEGRRAK